MLPLKNELMRLIENSDVRSVVGEPSLAIKTEAFNTNDFVEEINRCQSISDIVRVCHAIREHYGFDFFAIFVRVQRVNDKPLCFLLREYEDDWTNHYEANNLMLSDPTIRLAIANITPFIWSSHRFENVKHLLLPHELQISFDALDYGLRDIFNAPFRGCDGGCGLVRFINNKGGESAENQRARNNSNIPDLYYLASHIYETLSSILRQQNLSQPLTARETEVLLWTAFGKNPSAISDRLKISENTVVKHLHNVRLKLRVRTTTQAVAKAVASKVINI